MFAKIFRGSLIAAAGAVMTYITDAIPTIDIPANLVPVVTAAWAVAVNIARKWIESKQP